MSGRLMLKGLVTGNKTPSELADMAVGVLRKKRAQLVEALSGKVNDHHQSHHLLVLTKRSSTDPQP